MDIRKLVKSGLSSYTIALPKDWIDKNKLEKGKRLYIEERDNKLLISTEPKRIEPETKKIVISTEGKKLNTIKREIIAAYLGESNVIVIKGSNLQTHLSEIKNSVVNLIALEIVEETHNKIVAKSFLDINNVSASNIIRRIDNIVRSMLIDCIETIDREDFSKVISNRDYEVNRLSFLLFKILKNACDNPNIKRTLKLTNPEIIVLWQVNIHLEKIGDEIKRCSRIISDIRNSGKAYGAKTVKELFKDVQKRYLNVMKAFHLKDKILADDIREERKRIITACDKYFHKHKTAEGSEITGKIKGILSHLNDVGRLTGYLC